MSKKPKDVGVLESAQEVANLRRELHETSLSLAIHLNEMIDKKSTFVYQSVSNYLNCRLEFAEREATKLKEIKGHMDRLSVEKVVTPDEHKERLMKNFIQKNTIISVTFTKIMILILILFSVF
jgi:Cft2 family RNA processing exonuclease